MKKALSLIAILLIAALVLGACTSTPDAPAAPDAPVAPATPGPEPIEPSGDLPVVGISTGSSGTSWRNIMINAIEEVGNEYIEAGIISDFRIVNNVTNGDATEQANIIRDFIAQGVDIILINPNSPDALNGAIAEAQEAGILVVSMDATVTAPDVVNITLDHYAWNRRNVEYFAEALGSGSVIQIFGLDGHPANNDRVQATDDVLALHPDIEMISSTSGGWDQAVAKDVTLQIIGGGRQIDGVLTQDGMALGVLSAFQDNDLLPRVMFGDPGTAFFREWYELREAGADFRAFTQPNPPGIAGTAFRIAVSLWEGREFLPGVLDGNTLYYQVASFFTDENFEEAWAMLRDQPDDYLLSEIMSQADVDALFR